FSGWSDASAGVVLVVALAGFVADDAAQHRATDRADGAAAGDRRADGAAGSRAADCADGLASTGIAAARAQPRQRESENDEVLAHVAFLRCKKKGSAEDRKSTRLNSTH